jgi:hypothetical protein
MPDLYGGGMRALLVFDVEIDEGKRPSTRFRRLDQIVRTAAPFLGRLRHVRELRSVMVCDPGQAEGLAAEVRYDGRQLAPSLLDLPVALSR